MWERMSWTFYILKDIRQRAIWVKSGIWEWILGNRKTESKCEEASFVSKSCYEKKQTTKQFIKSHNMSYTLFWRILKNQSILLQSGLSISYSAFKHPTSIAKDGEKIQHGREWKQRMGKIYGEKALPCCTLH